MSREHTFGYTIGGRTIFIIVSIKLLYPHCQALDCTGLIYMLYDAKVLSIARHNGPSISFHLHLNCKL